MNDAQSGPPARIHAYCSSYGTYIVTVDGEREYETTNRIKAAGVAEYLRDHLGKHRPVTTDIEWA